MLLRSLTPKFFDPQSSPYALKASELLQGSGHFLSPHASLVEGNSSFKHVEMAKKENGGFTL